MLWDCLSDGNVKDIVEIDGLEKEERYRKILESQPDSSKLDRNYAGRLEKEKTVKIVENPTLNALKVWNNVGVNEINWEQFSKL